MRRLVLVGSVLAVVLVGPAVAGTAGRAQEATPAPVPLLLAEWAAAWTSGDPGRVAALYTEDAVYEEIPTGNVARGREDIRLFVAETHATFADIEVTPTGGYVAGERAVLEGIFAARSGGQPFAVPFVALFELDGDRIRHSRDYFDLYAVLSQTGQLPVPGTPASGTSAP